MALRCPGWSFIVTCLVALCHWEPKIDPEANLLHGRSEEEGQFLRLCGAGIAKAKGQWKVLLLLQKNRVVMGKV